MDLKGQTALVTGAGKGIGRAVALKLASCGADVVINYAGSEEAAKKTAQDCESFGVKALCIKCDVSDEKQVEEMVKEAAGHFGGIDILVNNAGITKDNIILRMSEQDFDDVIAINLKGVFNCMKHVSKLMLKSRYGRIISISSVVGIRGNAGQVNYSASKAGVIGMTKSLAKELASKGITVNAVAPGMIETDMTGGMNQEARERMLSSIPCGSMGKAEDIAEAVCFFAGKKSGYITGQVLSVDGGMAV